MAYMLTKKKSRFCIKFHLLFLIELAKKMKFLFVGKKVSSGKRKGQVWNFPVTIHSEENLFRHFKCFISIMLK